MLNRVVMQGGVVSEISPNQTQTAVRFRIGVNTGQKDADGNNISHYFNVICFQKQAEFAMKYLKKGVSVTVDGSVHDNNYVDSKGKKVYAKEICASSLSFANGEQVNVVILTGRLTRDPEIRYSTGSDPITVARYSIAVGKKPAKEGDPDADFIDCVTFGKSAENIEHYMSKGNELTVAGKLENYSYTMRDGNTYYGTQLHAISVSFAKKKEENKGNNADSTNSNNPYSFTTDGDGFMNIPDGLDEELPFN